MTAIPPQEIAGDGLQEEFGEGGALGLSENQVQQNKDLIAQLTSASQEEEFQFGSLGRGLLGGLFNLFGAGLSNIKGLESLENLGGQLFGSRVDRPGLDNRNLADAILTLQGQKIDLEKSQNKIDFATSMQTILHNQQKAMFKMQATANEKQTAQQAEFVKLQKDRDLKADLIKMAKESTLNIAQAQIVIDAQKDSSFVANAQQMRILTATVESEKAAAELLGIQRMAEMYVAAGLDIAKLRVGGELHKRVTLLQTQSAERISTERTDAQKEIAGNALKAETDAAGVKAADKKELDQVKGASVIAVFDNAVRLYNEAGGGHSAEIKIAAKDLTNPDVLDELHQHFVREAMVDASSNPTTAAAKTQKRLTETIRDFREITVSALTAAEESGITDDIATGRVTATINARFGAIDVDDIMADAKLANDMDNAIRMAASIPETEIAKALTAPGTITSMGSDADSLLKFDASTPDGRQKVRQGLTHFFDTYRDEIGRMVGASRAIDEQTHRFPVPSAPFEQPNRFFNPFRSNIESLGPDISRELRQEISVPRGHFNLEELGLKRR